MGDIFDFLSKNWVNLSLVIVGSFAMIIYKLQECQKLKDAASLIIIQIDDLQERIREIATYINDDKLSETAFYESLPLIDRNFWDEYKHCFVSKMDSQSYSLINTFYKYVLEIQEQQAFMNKLQKNHFFVMQNILASNESQLIMSSWNESFKGVSPQDISGLLIKIAPENMPEEDKVVLEAFFQQIAMQNQNFDINKFWSLYNQRKNIYISIFNNDAFLSYVPAQIKISLEKALKQCSLIAVIGTEGYDLLKEISKSKISVLSLIINLVIKRRPPYV